MSSDSGERAPAVSTHDTGKGVWIQVVVNQYFEAERLGVGKTDTRLARSALWPFPVGLT